MCALKVPKDYYPLEGSERRPSSNAKRIGPADPREVLTVTISIRRRPDGAPLPDPNDFLGVGSVQRPRYSDEEFARQYGAQEDIDKVAAFAASHNLTVFETNAAGRIVVVQGTVAQMSAAFAVELGTYEHEVRLRRDRQPQTERYRGRDGFIYIPDSLRSIVVGVFGLDNRRVDKHNGVEPPNTTTLTVPTVSRLYNYPTNSAAGQTTGIFPLSGYVSADITSYFEGLPPGYTAPGHNRHSHQRSDQPWVRSVWRNQSGYRYRGILCTRCGDKRLHNHGRSTRLGSSDHSRGTPERVR